MSFNPQTPEILINPSGVRRFILGVSYLRESENERVIERNVIVKEREIKRECACKRVLVSEKEC